MSAPRIDADARLGDLMRDNRRLADALESLGLDDCCGGALTLRQASEVRGIPLPDLIDRLRAAATPAPAPPSGGLRAPREPPGSLVASEGTRALYRRFLGAALWCTLTMGATFGAYNLLFIHLALGRLPPEHNWSHASFQILGFVLFFVMGVAYQVVPRFLGTELGAPRLARHTFLFALVGLLLRAYGQLGALVPRPHVAIAAGAALQLAALGGFAAVLLATYRRARPRREPFHRFLAVGTAWWLVTGFMLLAGGLRALGSGDPAAAATLNEPTYAAALFGGALAWIQGVLLRTGPVLLGLPAPRRPFVHAALLLGVVGTYLTMAGTLLPGGSAAAPRLLDLGMLALAADVVLYATGIRIFAGARATGDAPDRPLRTHIRLAFAGAYLFAILAAAWAAIDLLRGEAPQAIFDGARHAFGLGFVTLTILGMAGRLVPTFGGVALRRPDLHRLGIRLVALGLVLREAQLAAHLVPAPALLWVSGPSGIIAATGVALAAVSLLATLRAGRRSAGAGGPLLAIRMRAPR